ncbi:ATP-binding protein [Streptomyces sp. NPDC057743]|uniref:ATP-binding protein n=1 Tax=Streptomyces sp. NPDC057743 TaxID=3346236 RepID=UPI003692A5AA
MITTIAASPRSIGHPGYNATHPCTAETAAAARRFVRITCAAWGLDAHAETGALIISELVTNAVHHTSSHSIRVIVERPTATQVRLAVVDKAPYLLPTRLAPRPDDDRGRGLHLVDHLADRWGYDILGPSRRPWGKRCWAELRVEADPQQL